MTQFPIDDYIAEVQRHLKLRGPARSQALADLRELLEAGLEPGRAADYAANLDAQFGTDQDAFTRLTGIPNSFGRGLGRRLSGTFNPADERLLVPKVLGAGWSVNMGAVAVKLGLLRPDDVDDEVLTSAADHHLTTPRLIASIAVAVAAASAGTLVSGRRAVRLATGKSQTLNVAFGVAMPVLAAALLAASTNQEIPAAQRVTLPGLAADLALLTAGSNLQLTLRPTRQEIVLGSIIAALTTHFALSLAPVRAALTQAWHTQSTQPQGN